nr:hypothetical protein [Paucibacter sp. M5-1]MCZ7882647.1 hypothetical protein [Paucibacter sp. M5-1]
MSSARFSASFPAPVSAGAPLPTSLSVGERLGVWRIAAALHAGDSGRWYRAEHSLADDVSAALLVYQQSADAAAVLLRFAELSAALNQLSHPALATPLDSGLTAEGKPFWPCPGRTRASPCWPPPPSCRCASACSCCCNSATRCNMPMSKACCCANSIPACCGWSTVPSCG